MGMVGRGHIMVPRLLRSYTTILRVFRMLISNQKPGVVGIKDFREGGGDTLPRRDLVHFCILAFYFAEITGFDLWGSCLSPKRCVLVTV